MEMAVAVALPASSETLKRQPPESMRVTKTRVAAYQMRPLIVPVPSRK